MEQRLGRSIRQGNENTEVDIYRFVTEQTFDAYLYQLVEGKQKFASQIMTSKSPVRSCEDIDETALSYAEIKMLATGNPHIKEKMDLDIQVQKLRLLKSNFLSEKYALEDKLIHTYAQSEKKYLTQITEYEKDIEMLKSYTSKEFCEMKIGDRIYTEKKEAGEALLLSCRRIKSTKPVEIGSYKGFTAELCFDEFEKEYVLILRAGMSYRIGLGTDTYGNLTRIENVIEKIPTYLESAKQKLENVRIQTENAKEELKKEFPHEKELAEKSRRLDELNILLNLDDKEPIQIIEDKSEDAEIPEEHKKCKIQER